jgi:RNA polymerase sigma-70 factor (ECF subfamily)
MSSSKRSSSRIGAIVARASGRSMQPRRRERCFMNQMDEDLCPALARDLDATFERLVVTHQDRLYTIALRLLGDPRDAEEIVQDALVRAYRALAGYDAERIRALRLRAWLAAIVVNLARNRATRRRRPASVSLDGGAAEGQPVADRLSSPAGEPALIVERREGAARWAALLAALPDRYRTPIVLRHVDGLSFAEMSDALGRPEGTLKAQVHRGLALLRTAHEAVLRAELQEMTA